MVNWDMLKPRNLFVIAAIAVGAFYIFNHFAAKGAN